MDSYWHILSATGAVFGILGYILAWRSLDRYSTLKARTEMLERKARRG